MKKLQDLLFRSRDSDNATGSGKEDKYILKLQEKLGQLLSEIESCDDIEILCKKFEELRQCIVHINLEDGILKKCLDLTSKYLPSAHICLKDVCWNFLSELAVYQLKKFNETTYSRSNLIICSFLKILKNSTEHTVYRITVLDALTCSEREILDSSIIPELNNFLQSFLVDLISTEDQYASNYFTLLCNIQKVNPQVIKSSTLCEMCRHTCSWLTNVRNKQLLSSGLVFLNSVLCKFTPLELISEIVTVLCHSYDFDSRSSSIVLDSLTKTNKTDLIVGQFCSHLTNTEFFNRQCILKNAVLLLSFSLWTKSSNRVENLPSETFLYVLRCLNVTLDCQSLDVCSAVLSLIGKFIQNEGSSMEKSTWSLVLELLNKCMKMTDEFILGAEKGDVEINSLEENCIRDSFSNLSLCIIDLDERNQFIGDVDGFYCLADNYSHFLSDICLEKLLAFQSKRYLLPSHPKWLDCLKKLVKKYINDKRHGHGRKHLIPVIEKILIHHGKEHEKEIFKNVLMTPLLEAVAKGVSGDFFCQFIEMIRNYIENHSDHSNILEILPLFQSLALQKNREPDAFFSSAVAAVDILSYLFRYSIISEKGNLASICFDSLLKVVVSDEEKHVKIRQQAKVSQQSSDSDDDDDDFHTGSSMNKNFSTSRQYQLKTFPECRRDAFSTLLSLRANKDHCLKILSGDLFVNSHNVSQNNLTYSSTIRCHDNSCPHDNNDANYCYLNIQDVINAVILCLSNEKEWFVYEKVLNLLLYLLRNKLLVSTCDLTRLCSVLSSFSKLKDSLPDYLKKPRSAATIYDGTSMPGRWSTPVFSKSGSAVPATTSERSLSDDGPNPGIDYSDVQMANDALLLTEKEKARIFHHSIVSLLTSLASYNLNRQQQKTMICSVINYLQTMTVFREAMFSLHVYTLELPGLILHGNFINEILHQIAQRSLNASAAIPVLEFLSSLVYIPAVAKTFSHKHYQFVFNIALKCTRREDFDDHYVITLAYQVISSWFIRCRKQWKYDSVKMILNSLQKNLYNLRNFTRRRFNTTIGVADEEARTRVLSRVRSNRKINLGSSGVTATVSSTTKSSNISSIASLISDFSFFGSSSSNNRSSRTDLFTSDNHDNAEIDSSLSDGTTITPEQVAFQHDLAQVCACMLAHYTRSSLTNGSIISRANGEDFFVSDVIAHRETRPVDDYIRKRPFFTLTSEKNKKPSTWLIGNALVTVTVHCYRMIDGKTNLCDKCLKNRLKPTASIAKTNVIRTEENVTSEEDEVYVQEEGGGDSGIETSRAQEGGKMRNLTHRCSCDCLIGNFAEVTITRATGITSFVLKVKITGTNDPHFSLFPLSKYSELIGEDYDSNDKIGDVALKVDEASKHQQPPILHSRNTLTKSVPDDEKSSSEFSNNRQRKNYARMSSFSHKMGIDIERVKHDLKNTPPTFLSKSQSSPNLSGVSSAKTLTSGTPASIRSDENTLPPTDRELPLTKPAVPHCESITNNENINDDMTTTSPLPPNKLSLLSPVSAGTVEENGENAVKFSIEPTDSKYSISDLQSPPGDEMFAMSPSLFAVDDYHDNGSNNFMVVADGGADKMSDSDNTHGLTDSEEDEYDAMSSTTSSSETHSKFDVDEKKFSVLSKEVHHNQHSSKPPPSESPVNTSSSGIIAATITDESVMMKSPPSSDRRRFPSSPQKSGSVLTRELEMVKHRASTSGVAELKPTLSKKLLGPKFRSRTPDNLSSHTSPIEPLSISTLITSIHYPKQLEKPLLADINEQRKIHHDDLHEQDKLDQLSVRDLPSSHRGSNLLQGESSDASLSNINDNSSTTSAISSASLSISSSKNDGTRGDLSPQLKDNIANSCEIQPRPENYEDRDFDAIELTPEFVLLNLLTRARSQLPVQLFKSREYVDGENGHYKEKRDIIEDLKPLFVDITRRDIQTTLKSLHHCHPFDRCKIGVIYVGPNQYGNEYAILSNEESNVSERFSHLINSLGKKISLVECNPDKIYVGGLDTSRNLSDGTHAMWWQDPTIQVIFHVAPMMPNRTGDTERSCKKRHIGNDYVTIVYNDSGVYFYDNDDFDVFLAHKVNILVEPLDNDTSVITVHEKIISSDGGQMRRPPIIVSDKNLPLVLRQLAVHRDLASLIQQRKIVDPTNRDPYACNWLERLRTIKRLRSKIESSSSSISGNNNACSTAVTHSASSSVASILGGNSRNNSEHSTTNLPPDFNRERRGSASVGGGIMSLKKSSLNSWTHASDDSALATGYRQHSSGSTVIASTKLATFIDTGENEFNRFNAIDLISCLQDDGKEDTLNNVSPSTLFLDEFWSYL